MGACYLTIDVRYEKGGIVHRRKPISRDWNRQQTKYKDEKNCQTQNLGFKVCREIIVGDCDGSIEIQFTGAGESPEITVKGIILRTK